uniref:Uncharacterized protein n=1 Tax=Anopheles albimanus TaxID=7167 RepID=A0A8W7K9Z3_ANOAL
MLRSETNQSAARQLNTRSCRAFRRKCFAKPSTNSYSYYDIGRAIGCAHRPQPSALSKRDKAFRVPWKEDDDDQRPAEDPTIVMSCRECEDDTPMDRPVVEVAKP